MDIISHGLWGGVAFGRKNKFQYLQSFFFGMFPDLFSFGIYWIGVLMGFHTHPEFSAGHPGPDAIPMYVHTLYNLTHSLVIFLSVLAALWIIRKKPFILLLAWGLHILIDIPTHSLEFFATPFLWPLSDFKVDGINWGSPIIFYPNIILLFAAYFTWWIFYKKNKKNNF